MLEEHLPPELSSLQQEYTMDPIPEPLPSSGTKRRASVSFEGMRDDSRKRLKEGGNSGQLDAIEQSGGTQEVASNPTSTVDLVEELYDELSCGTDAALACFIAPLSSPLASTSSAEVIDTLLRAAPHKARTERECQQADEIYKGGVNMRIPTPREASPEPNLNLNGDFARPCPHCLPNNPYRWTCPQPIPDPNTDVDHAWHMEDGFPPGHAPCGNCEVLLALQAPTTSKCDFCRSSFCGISVPGRCVAAPLLAQQLQGMADVGDLIQCADVYDCFNGNTVEVDFMLDYMTAQGLTPRHIYKDIVSHIKSQPRQFAPLIEQDIFMDNSTSSEPDVNAESPREQLCRRCATEIFIWGLKDWWIRERQKGFVEEPIAGRKDCPNGSECTRQKDLGHAKEFNHIFSRTAQGSSSQARETEVPIAEGDMSVIVDVGGLSSTLPVDSDIDTYF
ncbi:hypothetical protein VNI00_011077 [Paramarasmius palmivorus]|uniref:E3 ubiquitin-protein ligase CHFR cysteine rich domain-containing protein n=1 Tax=Paramarasmius palmivorus TaxID=297713 RepID=A0AAW0CEV2_9AGAR